MADTCVELSEFLHHKAAVYRVINFWVNDLKNSIDGERSEKI